MHACCQALLAKSAFQDRNMLSRQYMRFRAVRHLDRFSGAVADGVVATLPARAEEFLPEHIEIHLRCGMRNVPDSQRLQLARGQTSEPGGGTVDHMNLCRIVRNDHGVRAVIHCSQQQPCSGFATANTRNALELPFDFLKPRAREIDVRGGRWSSCACWSSAFGRSHGLVTITRSS